MRALLGLQQRDAEPRLLAAISLQLVQELGLLPRALVEDRVGQGEEAAAGAEARLVGPRGEAPARLHLRRDALARAVLVDARHVHLADLLLERHAAEEVVDPGVDRQGRVDVIGAARGPGQQEQRRLRPGSAWLPVE